MNAYPKKKPILIIVGAAGHGLVVHDIIAQTGRYEVVGFLDSGKPAGMAHAGLKVLGPVEAVAGLSLQHAFTECVVAIGHNATRRACVERVSTACPAMNFPAVVHPSAMVAPGVMLGEGTVVMAGVMINPGCVIGRHCILNTGSHLDHESRLEDYASLAPGVVTGGNVQVGPGTAICLGALVINGIHIGSDVVVGAGALVMHDLPDACVAYGSPACRIRARKPADNYL
jgi:sugar O-acyltransferase (sialic acid O-acetyltransferase NeuD family)